MATLAIAASALGVPHNAQAQDADETRIVNSIRVTVRFDSGSYTLDESAGRTASQISLIARTRANTLPPLTGFRVAVLTRDGTAESPDDYQRVSRRVSFGGPFGGNWVAAGNAYESRVRVPVRIAQDDLVEGDEGFRLLLQLVGREPTVAVVPADLTAPQCTADGCQSSVTIVDDDSRDATESNSGEVTIAARHDTALQGIDPLEFVVTRSGAVDESLEVSVTLSSGVVSERKLSRTVTIPAGAAAGAFSVPTDKLASGAATGDVTAAVDDSADYEVGEPSSASIRLHVGDPLVTVRFSEESYSVDEGVGVVTESRLIARTAPNVPAPSNAVAAAVVFQPGTATTPEDYTAGVLLLSFAAAGWTAEGDTFVARSAVPFTVIDDTEAEDAETLSMQLVRPPDAPDTVNFVSADGSGSECPALQGCSAGVTILDDDEAPPDDEQGVHSGAVSITAKHPTALQGIDDLVFTVTRAVSLDSDLEVPLTLSSGIIDADRLSHTVTIGANETSAELRVHTTTLDPAATTGYVIATVADGEQYDVPDLPTASVRVYVGETLVTVRLNAASYTLDENVGRTTDEITLIAKTGSGIPAPNSIVMASISTKPGDAAPPDDYAALSSQISFGEQSGASWVAVDNGYQSEVQVPLTVVDDDLVEGDERLQLVLQRAASTPATVGIRPANSSAPRCPGFDGDSECTAPVTVTDDDGVPPEDDPVPDPVDVSDPVVVSLVHVPDGTVIPDDSTLSVGGTVLDGTTFAESDMVLFRLLLSDQHGGPAPAGADVELSFEWTHHSPIVPTSGQISRIVLSLYRVDVWDSAVQILDNTVGNPDSTVTVRITGCERNGCVIGEPSEITVTIADDDGGPAAAPPGRPPRPAVLCPDRGHSSLDTGLKAIWEAPDFVGGAPIDSYEVRYRQRRLADDVLVYGDWQAWPRSGAAVSATITGLDTDTAYGVQVRAVNANGPGEWSLEGTHRTGQPDYICDILDQLAESQ